MCNNILHIDMDAFFASVEQHDDESLKGKPVIVGSIKRRGVVSTCSYEAREYGIYSSMPIFMAMEKCPQGVYLDGRYSRYKEVSNIIFSIFQKYTSKIEKMSIDEAFLDISQVHDNALEIARAIKKEVFKKTSLTLSVGISYNKFLAKIASEWNKPNGIKIISKDMIPDILFPLKINKIYGIGKVSLLKLNNMGIFTVKDLYSLSEEFLINYLGKSGEDVYKRIRGIDKREVKEKIDSKSCGKEVTLKDDILDKNEMLSILKPLCFEVNDMLNKRNVTGKTITFKFKTTDFHIHTRSKTLNYYIYRGEDIFNVVKELIFNEGFKLKVRLLGVSVSSFKENTVEQITMF
ncbi:DNA polymerase IV [Clostridium sp. BJN0001]|uniref:DNA polymerase IV n=1 Tax=Clostridium sp. BJN0001 TaxID=2930219 RepID=UPI001FD52415|nr:DNA polymerase IV [Clostridium sp. BJN0001]